ncbi:Hint domain-containing protein [Roseovarius sp. S4756]|uniref:Hint domain-containing protein n=1 Tax=Roseovarius maritimus TaxID=3342637 RepID=UPI0037284699
MPTYTIVDKDSVTLGPGEIRAGGQIQVSDGDVFILSSSAADKIDFQTTGSNVDFELRIDSSNANDFDIKIGASLTPTFSIADNVDLSSIKIDAKSADGLVVDAGDGVSIEKIDGAANGPNTVTLGDDFTILSGLKLGEADDILIVGDRASLQDVETGKGDDTVRLGDDASADKIKTEDGNDRIFIANDGAIKELDGGNGGDTLFTASTPDKTSNIETTNIVCFAQGTLIDTADGPCPVETLAVGDLVRTTDHGLQPLRWLGLQVLEAEYLKRNPHQSPVCIDAGAMGPGLPDRSLRVSPQHRICIASPIAERIFGQPEILLPAKKLTALGGIRQLGESGEVHYYHLLFDVHEVIFAEGLPCESLLLGEQAMLALGPQAMDQIRTLQARPGMRISSDVLARPCPTRGNRWRQLIKRHIKNRKPLIRPPDLPADRALAG